jgi:hypothetical protein
MDGGIDGWIEEERERNITTVVVVVTVVVAVAEESTTIQKRGDVEHTMREHFQTKPLQNAILTFWRSCDNISCNVF